MVTNVNRQHKNYNMIFHNILIKKKKGLKRALETFNLSEYQPDNFLLSKGWQFTQQVKEENAKFIPCPTFKISNIS